MSLITNRRIGFWKLIQIIQEVEILKYLTVLVPEDKTSVVLGLYKVSVKEKIN